MLGIRDENGTAQEVVPVTLSDGEERRMHQGLRARTVPFIPDVEIRPMALDTTNEGQQKGFYLIMVGRSLLAPHGVMAQGDDKKRIYWPVRDGTTTRYLNEPELADFYRRRFRGEEERERELDKVRDEGLERLSSGLIWLVVQVVPSLPGRLPTGGALLRHVQRMAWDWADEFWPMSSFGLPLRQTPRLGRFVPGVRRTMWDADNFEKSSARTAFAEFHQSGAGFAAVTPAHQNSFTVLHQPAIEAELLGLFHLLGRHARDARATGELTVRAGLYANLTRTMTLGRPHVMSTEVVQINGALYANGTFTAEPFSVGLDELLSYEGVARVAYQFATDIAGRFGVPDAGLLTETGTLRQDSGGLPEFFPWAESVGLLREQGV